MKPLLLHYFITNRCNAKCSFCEIWKEQPKVDAHIEEVFANLTSARKAGCRFVDFTGGEPLLHSGLPILLKEAKKLGYITSVTTNAILFPSQAPNLAGLIDLLHFSIDADSASLHDEIRGRDSFADVIDSIPIALSHNLFPDLLFTYTEANIDSFMGVYSLARKNKLIVILDPVFSVDGSKDKVSADTHKKAKSYAGLPGVYLNKAHLLLRKKGGNDMFNTFCKAVSSAIVILPDNTIALPCYHHRTESLYIGSDLLQILDDPRRLQAQKEQGTHSFCHGCHINCYFDPSYTFVKNRFFLLTMTAKIRYAFQKFCIYKRPIPHFITFL